MTRHRRHFYLLSTMVAGFLLFSALLPSDAAGDRIGGRFPDGPARAAASLQADEVSPFDEAALFFELNDTDGDLGIHGLIDGDAWSVLTITHPSNRRILRLSASGSMRRQGLTELSFESAEPTFDELDPEDFFLRFPEGTYEIEGTTIEGDHLEGEATLSHVLAAPASNITLSGIDAPGLRCRAAGDQRSCRDRLGIPSSAPMPSSAARDRSRSWAISSSSRGAASGWVSTSRRR